MPWYDDPSKTQFTGSYSNEKQYRWDLEAAAKRGWTVQPTETEGEEPVIGEQPKTRLTVTFVRREDWLASRKEEIARSLTETASRSADEKEARHVKAADELRRSEEQLDARIASLSTVDDSGREQAERDVLGALKEVMLKRRNALRAKDEAIKEMDAAVAVGAGEFARSMSLLIRSREQEAARLDAESALLASQEVVTRAAKDWKDAAERRRAAEEQLRKREAEFDVRDEALKARMSERDRLLIDLSVTV